jgi:hypothetical protein
MGLTITLVAHGHITLQLVFHGHKKCPTISLLGNSFIFGIDILPKIHIIESPA